MKYVTPMIWENWS